MSTNAEPQTEEGCKCNMNKDTWVLTLRIAAIFANVAVILICIFTLLPNFANLVTFVLDIYILIFASLCFIAELRFISVVRSTAYYLLKWFYFLTNYTGRGIFYFFLGTLLVDGDSTICNIVAVCVMALGVLWIVIARYYGLEAPKDKTLPGQGANEKSSSTPAPTPTNVKTPATYNPPVAPASPKETKPQPSKPAEAAPPPPAIAPAPVLTPTPTPQPQQSQKTSYPYQYEEHPNPFADPK
eukprot:PhF_6_TR19625/c0_g1_i1/m.28635